ncbi:MAG: hypothetical protein FWG49_07290, partial [Leptospirales bacterium]|nr:hypothetical protein [Leptospirales bacterium]
MKSILEIKGFAVIEGDNLIKVVPIKEALQKNIDVIVDGDHVKLGQDSAVTFILELSNADANEIANVLRTIKTVDTEIVVYRPLNVLIFNGNATDIKGLVKVAKELDKTPEEISDSFIDDGATVHVVNLENADAVNLAEVLSRIPFSQNSVINNTPIRNDRQQQPQPNQQQPNRQQNQPVNQQPYQQPLKLSIVPNKETNSLIINATGNEFREILRIIKQLDIVRPQILIEAMIIEVDASSSWGFGINWGLGGQAGNSLLGGSSIMGNIPSYQLPSGNAVANKTMVVPLEQQTMYLGYLNNKSILSFMLLNATGTNSNINILSTPHILTIDNQEAEFNVGESIAVPSNNRMDSNNNMYYTFEYQPVGLKLKLTPHITTGDKITLELYVEANSVLGSTTTSLQTIIPPNLAKRDIRTKVSIQDGATIVVGGLMRNTTTEIENKVPLLGDIPLLGWFFKSKSKEDTKTNLLVFITPKVVTDPEKMKKITEEKRQEFNRNNDEIMKMDLNEK